MNINKMIDLQVKYLEQFIGPRRFPGLFKNRERWLPFGQAPTYLNVPLPQIPGMSDPNRKKVEIQRDRDEYTEQMAGIRSKLLKILGDLQTDERFGQIFRSPVTEEIAPRYFETIQKPMDFQTMERRLTRFPDYYKSPEAFASDVQLMIENCKLFNSQDTVFYKAANQCFQKFKALLAQEFPEGT
jgi:histone acetyltransferase